MGRRVHPRYEDLTPERKREVALLYESNRMLALKACSKYVDRRGCGYLKQDLEREALIALWRAALGFVEARGYKFSTYAYRIIFNHLMRMLPTLRAPFSIPSWVIESLTVEDKLPISIHLDPRVWDVSLREIGKSAGDALILNESVAHLLEVVDTLPEPDRTVVLARYGIGRKKVSAAKLGKELGCSRYAIAAVLKRAIVELKKRMT